MNTPHGGELVQRWVRPPSAEELDRFRREYRTVAVLHERFVIDALAIAQGIYSPLRGFLGKADVERVIEEFRLADGTPWAIPIVLPVLERELVPEGRVLLTWLEQPFAWMEIREVFQVPMKRFVQGVFGTDDVRHPGVDFWTGLTGCWFVAGEISVFRSPLPFPVDARYLLSPAQVREAIRRRGWKRIVAFQTRNPIHRAHEYLIKCALEMMDGVLIHPLVGATKQDDIPAPVRMQCYEVLVKNYFPESTTLLSALYANMHYAGPREALHHMIMRKNFGCTHMIIGRDHAGVGNYYGPYDAQELACAWSSELGIEPVCFDHAFYCRRCGGTATRKTCPHPESEHFHLSGTELRRRLRAGEPIPEEFSRKEVLAILRSWVQSAS